MGPSGPSTVNAADEARGAVGTQRADPRAKRPLLLKLAFSFVLLIVVLGVAEIGLRFLTPTQLGFRYSNGWFSHPPEYTSDATRNQQGFHDADHGPKRPGVRRVLLLGDSYVHASTVRISETPGQRLEHHLNARSDQAYEVVAIGGGGWGQGEQLSALRDRGLETEPDIVVTLFMSLNDVSDNSAALKRRDRAQRQKLHRRRPGHTLISADEAPLFFFRWLALNQLLSHRLAYLLRDKTLEGIPLPYFVYAQSENELWSRAWRETEMFFLLTNRAVTATGARYAVVAASTPHGVWGAEEGLDRLVAAYPGMRELQWDLDKPDKGVERLCQAAGIPFLALEPLFRVETVEKGRRLHFRYDGHWNVEGNDLAAQYIADFLLSLEDAPEPPRP